MASSSALKVIAFKADGAIAKGKAVKMGSDDEHVVVCAANTDEAIGVAQNAATTAEDVVEVALPGGGAKVLLGEAVTAGKLLVSHTDGTLVKANASGDRLVALAIEGGESGDLVGAEIVVGHAVKAE